MNEFKRDLIVYWVIHIVSVLFFAFVGSGLVLLGFAPLWALGVSLTVGAISLFGLQTYWVWKKWVIRKEPSPRGEGVEDKR